MESDWRRDGPRRVRERPTPVKSSQASSSPGPCASRRARARVFPLLYGLGEQPVFENDVSDEGCPQKRRLRRQQAAEPGVLVQARDDAAPQGLDVAVAQL